MTVNRDKNALQRALEAEKIAWLSDASEHKKMIYDEGLKGLEKSKIISNALQGGNIAPDFELPNAVGKKVKLYDFLKAGPVILTWYRGGWCPYCNITLQYLQKALSDFKKENANLLALTPELPDSSLSTKEKNNLEFEVLSDIGNAIGKKYGVVYKLTPEVTEIYLNGFDLYGYNGDESNELPLAGTYIINQSGVIIYAFLDVDYRKRAEPVEIIKVLKELSIKI